MEGNGYEGRQTSKGELFVKVFGMSRDFEGASINSGLTVCIGPRSNTRGKDLKITNRRSLNEQDFFLPKS